MKVTTQEALQRLRESRRTTDLKDQLLAAAQGRAAAAQRTATPAPRRSYERPGAFNERAAFHNALNAQARARQDRLEREAFAKTPAGALERARERFVRVGGPAISARIEKLLVALRTAEKAEQKITNQLVRDLWGEPPRRLVSEHGHTRLTGGAVSDWDDTNQLLVSTLIFVGVRQNRIQTERTRLQWEWKSHWVRLWEDDPEEVASWLDDLCASIEAGVVETALTKIERRHRHRLGLAPRPSEATRRSLRMEAVDNQWVVTVSSPSPQATAWATQDAAAVLTAFPGVVWRSADDDLIRSPAGLHGTLNAAIAALRGLGAGTMPPVAGVVLVGTMDDGDDAYAVHRIDDLAEKIATMKMAAQRDGMTPEVMRKIEAGVRKHLRLVTEMRERRLA